MTRRALTLSLVLFAMALPAAGSDHADPIILRSLDAGITGLFAFADGDDLALILTVRRSTTSPPPYDLEGLEFTIHIDTHSRVHWGDRENNARYGGTVEQPAGISADATIRFRLQDDGSFVRGYPVLEGFATPNTRPSNEFSGPRDDPFIFPRFAKSNVVAMVVTLPFSAFKGNPDTFLLWGTTTKEGLFGGQKQVDHVGRSARTQAARFDFLNTLPPNEHVQAIDGRLHGMQASLEKAFSHLSMHMLSGPGDLYAYVFGIRERYDIFPDVMIFSRGREPGYPNGRRPEDDVVGKTCEVGDCILQEIAYYEAAEGEFPRRTVHDPPPSPNFPYLTEPLPTRAEEPEADHCWRNFIVLLILFFIALTFWRRWCCTRNERPYVRPYSQRH